jgi:transposase InsO family protein
MEGVYMPWKECFEVNLRQEAVLLATGPGGKVSVTARRFGVSRQVLHKWISRYESEGITGLGNRSRRPAVSPTRTSEEVERVVVNLRERYPRWGSRKLRAVLLRRGADQVPSERTITRILHRYGLIDPEESAQRVPWKRFERREPNDLMQMDFKGHFGLEDGRRCHPLTMLDDHSRYCLTVRAFGNERLVGVRRELIRVFERYGLPRQILTDNGAPWGNAMEYRFTKLSLWLMDHGVEVLHSTPMHPQTQGKLERMHRTLKADVITGRSYRSLAACQEAFDAWRRQYNHERPHEALGLCVPADRYSMSRRSFQETVPPWEYDVGVDVRKVDGNGRLCYDGVIWRIGKPFVGRHVSIAPGKSPGSFDVRYRHQWVASLDPDPS